MKLLYLVHRFPYPPNRGDRIRSYNLLKFLSERCDVHLACLTEEAIAPEDYAAVERLCERMVAIPLSPKDRWLRAAVSLSLGRSATEGLFYSQALMNLVSEWSLDVQYRSVLAFCSSMVPYCQAPGLEGVPLVVDLVDVDSQKWFDYSERASGIRRRLFQMEGFRVRQLEKEAVERAKAVTLVSEPEAQLLREAMTTVAEVCAIGNGVDVDAYETDRVQQSDRPFCILFVGALDYLPNVQGIGWFAEHIWPTIHAELPEVVLKVVGRNPVASVKQLSKLPGVEVVGTVPDVRPYLAGADVTIAPLHIARGIQNKVLESMAAAKPIVATSKALEGIDLTVGVHALRADTADEWIEQIRRLHDDAEYRHLVGRAGHSLVSRNHSWDIQLAPFASLLEIDTPAAELEACES